MTSSAPFSTTTSPALRSLYDQLHPATWEPGQVATFVLESSVVQSYIASAYSYHIGDLKPSPSNPNLISRGRQRHGSAKRERELGPPDMKCPTLA